MSHLIGIDNNAKHKGGFAMKKLLKLTALILAAAITFTFSGCMDRIIEELTTDYIPEEECRLLSGIDAEIYTYSDKLQLYLSFDYPDELSINCGKDGEDEWYEILRGDFSESAWYDHKHVVLFNDVYYEFDIGKYKVGRFNKDGDPVYELKEYTKSEFAKAYPDYESFEWYGVTNTPETTFTEQ